MRKFFLALCLMFFYMSMIFSKEVNLTIKDKDLESPLEGVKVLDKTNNKNYTSDKNGKVKFNVSDKSERIIINISLIGYESKAVNIKEFDKEVILKMSITGILEGKELVIEGKTSHKEEQIGVSKVINKETMKATAEIGSIEDVFSAMKMLPGVGYTGGFVKDFSIRGGDQSEFTALYDGFLVRQPYQWGQSVSIFNPNIVSSFKFSPGIFGAKYGYATSALLEIDTYKPDKGLQFKTAVSSNTAEFFLQTPVGLSNAGILIGTRITYSDLEMLMAKSMLSNMGVTLKTPGYIRDGYFKWYWRPTDRFEWYLNAFFGSDGIAMSYTNENDNTVKSEIYTDFDMNYYRIDGFSFTGFKAMPNDIVQMNFLVGYEYFLNGFTAYMNEHGKRNYSQDFINVYGGMLGGKTNFEVKDKDSAFFSNDTLHSIQTRYDVDIKLHERITMNVGLGGFYDFLFYEAGGKFWTLSYDATGPVYKKESYDVNAENKRYLKYFGYLGFKFSVVPETLDIEVGCRIDHMFIYAPSFSNGTLNVYPAPGPRFLITYTPVRKLVWLDKLILSAGVGLFSKAPLEAEKSASGEYGIKDFDVKIPKVLNTVAGIELDFPFEYKFKVEGYFKYGFDRLYMNWDSSTPGGPSYYIHSDGIARIAGFEISLERSLSKYIDGLISYSFNYSSYYNPETDNIASETDSSGNPTGKWYYPSFHRWHILNILLNIRPVSFVTITPSFKLATGLPDKEVGSSKDMFYARMDDGTILELYSRKKEYSDTLRTDISIPFNIKFSFNFYFPKSKVSFEVWAAVEDLFKFAYSPKSSMNTDKYTGDEQRSSTEGYDYPIPTPSMGFKLSF